MRYDRKPKKVVIKALNDSFGNVSHAAKILGMSRSGLSKKISLDPSLQEIIDQFRETIVDKAESQLHLAVNKGAAWAVALTLRTIGRHRGYVERVETDDRSPAPPNPWEGKTDDEIKEIIRQAIKTYFPNGLDGGDQGDDGQAGTPVPA